MAYTYIEIQSLIEANLANNSNIFPIEHRGVAHALLDFIKDNLPVVKGTVVVGDVLADQTVNVTFDDIFTSNYMVVTTVVSNGLDGFDNNIVLAIKNKTSTSFDIIAGDYSFIELTQNISIDYLIFLL